MSKTLLKLIDKAIARESGKRYGEATIKNPRRSGKRNYFNNDQGSTYTAEYQWKVIASRIPDEDVVTQVCVFHYDTLIANIELGRGSWLLNHWYGIGPSDRDALNAIAEKFNLVQRFFIRQGELKETITI